MAQVSKVIQGLQILAKYVPEDSYGIAAEHDVLYGPGDPGEVSEEDRQKLEDLGWLIDEEVDSYFIFV